MFNWNRRLYTHKFPYGSGLYLNPTLVAYTIIIERLPFSL